MRTCMWTEHLGKSAQRRPCLHSSCLAPRGHRGHEDRSGRSLRGDWRKLVASVDRVVAATAVGRRNRGDILMVKQALFIAGCVAGFGLQACNNSAADPAKVAAEVQKAEAEGEKKIVEAQAKLEKVAAENKKDIVVARADARIDAVDDAAAKSGDTAKRFEAGKTDAKQPEAIEPAAPPADENVTRTRVAAMGK